MTLNAISRTPYAETEATLTCLAAPEAGCIEALVARNTTPDSDTVTIRCHRGGTIIDIWSATVPGNSAVAMPNLFNLIGGDCLFAVTVFGRITVTVNIDIRVTNIFQIVGPPCEPGIDPKPSMPKFAPIAYTGAGPVTSVGFQPDLVWLKSRTNTDSHHLYDRVRGANKAIFSDSILAEATVANGLSSFDADGFTVGSEHDESTIAWCWSAGGGAPVANTAGTIASTVLAAPDGHFSIISYDGVPGTPTVGHGLQGVPELLIGFPVNDGRSNWIVWHKALGALDRFLRLNTSAAVSTSPQFTNLDASVVGVGNGANTNLSGQRQILYAFRSVAGISHVGHYEGNGSTDGPAVNTGFSPRWVMVKRATGGPADWAILDIERSGSNPINDPLRANLSIAEASDTSTSISFTTGGFKVDGTSDEVNANGSTYVYLAMV